MLPIKLTSTLQVLPNSRKPLIAATTNESNPVTKLEPGQQLQGAIQSKVSEGLFKVQVAGQSIQMRLPGNTKIGDTLRLEVVTTQPKITFSMAASTNPLSDPEQIGATARLLSNLVELPVEKLVVRQFGNSAVWQTGQQMPDTMQLAVALRDALGKSGLFYESHQAQWIRGERSMNKLLEEPQNLLARKPSGDNESAAPAFKPAGDAQIAKELLPLVQQQLHTLEHHHLSWEGQVWPGQQMQWEIQGEPEHQSRQQDERKWSTEMELALPRLGDVSARLMFTENRLQLVLHAADQKTVDLFNRSLHTLKDSLANVGIALSSAVVAKS